MLMTYLVLYSPLLPSIVLPLPHLFFSVVHYLPRFSYSLSPSPSLSHTRENLMIVSESGLFCIIRSQILSIFASTNVYLKKLILLASKEMKIKSTFRFCSIPSWMVIIKKTKLRILMRMWREMEFSTLWEGMWVISINMEISIEIVGELCVCVCTYRYPSVCLWRICVCICMWM